MSRQPRLCWEFHELRTPWGPIKLEQHGPDRFRVTYGKQVEDELTYAKACEQLGQALLHWLSCGSYVDNRERGDSRTAFIPAPQPPTE